MNTLNVEMHINDLADFMFVKNVNDAIIGLQMDGIEDNKDLFYFCLDLFCKGLVLMYGNGNSVNVDEISMEQFTSIQKKMKNAGILVHLSVFEDIDDNDNSSDSDNGDHDKASVNIDHIESLPNTLPINEYMFVLRNGTHVYRVTFDLVHTL